MNPQFARVLATLHQQRPEAKILDIGGWFAPCRQATHMVDIMPFATMNIAGAYGHGELKIQPENYFQVDLGAIDRLPFDDKSFDFVICRHTLEDIKDPLFVSREIMRVGKAGFIEVPHRIYESTKGVERPWWCGHYHHRWLVEIIGQKVIFQVKPHNLHSHPAFFWRCLPWQKVREAYKNTSLLWTDRFDVEERVIIDYCDVKQNLRDFKAAHRGLPIKRLRWIQDRNANEGTLA